MENVLVTVCFLVIGVALRRLSDFPPQTGTVLNLVPLVMVAVGFQLTLRLDRQVAAHLSIGLGIKLVLVPLAAWAVCRWIGLDGPAVQVAIFESGMPPMVTAGALAMSADLAPDLAAALVGIGIMVSFATLPLVYQLL